MGHTLSALIIPIAMLAGFFLGGLIDRLYEKKIEAKARKKSRSDFDKSIENYKALNGGDNEEYY